MKHTLAALFLAITTSPVMAHITSEPHVHSDQFWYMLTGASALICLAIFMIACRK